jgi:hypothetical protein
MRFNFVGNNFTGKSGNGKFNYFSGLSANFTRITTLEVGGNASPLFFNRLLLQLEVCLT